MTIDDTHTFFAYSQHYIWGGGTEKDAIYGRIRLNRAFLANFRWIHVHIQYMYTMGSVHRFIHTDIWRRSLAVHTYLC